MKKMTGLKKWWTAGVTVLIGAMLFLLDDASAGFITGVVLPVDGGFGAYSGV